MKKIRIKNGEYTDRARTLANKAGKYFRNIYKEYSKDFSEDDINIILIREANFEATIHRMQEGMKD